MKKKILKLCEDAVKSRISPQNFYRLLDEISQSEECEDDLACIIEDAMMELDMTGGISRTAVKEAAQMIAEEIGNI
ncbi:MAG: hypothetical protein IJ080_05440 [Oscillospiraceae bacterium]|nr:hypothetical protein [Oscillospiraceae bacterium]